MSFIYIVLSVMKVADGKTYTCRHLLCIHVDTYSHIFYQIMLYQVHKQGLESKQQSLLVIKIEILF
jgi:hypothetical protein